MHAGDRSGGFQSSQRFDLLREPGRHCVSGAWPFLLEQVHVMNDQLRARRKHIPCVKGRNRLHYWKVRVTGNPDKDTATGNEMAFWTLAYLRETKDYAVLEFIARDQPNEGCYVQTAFWAVLAEFTTRGSFAMTPDMLCVGNLATAE